MLNGQTQGFEGKTFISMELGFRQLREYMLVSVDCTNIKASVRNNIFMSSRDRMREGKYYSLIKEKLIALLKNDDVLKQLNQEYKGKEYSTLFGYYSNESNENLPDRNAMAMITDDLNEAISTIFQHYGAFLMDFSETDLTDE